MSLFNLKNLGVTLGTPLFSGLDVTINDGDRIGLVAANGRGKSTLLRCLAGKIEPTTGDITRRRGLRIGHVEQETPGDQMELSIYDFVLRALPAEQAEAEGWRVDLVLDDLAVSDDLRGRPLNQLSGGWRQIARLAAAWVIEPDLLLMDEPTNHLDLARIVMLQDWLATLPRSLSIMLASHDRAFLDAVTNRTLFLRETTSQVFALPYTRARSALAVIDATEKRQFDNDMKQARKLRQQAAKLKNIGVNSGSDLLVVKTKQLKERADKIEESARLAHKPRSAGEIRLSNSDTHAKALVTLKNAKIAAPDGHLLFKTGEIRVTPGDRIVLLGTNGSGKSQFASKINLAFTRGAEGVQVAPSVVLGHSDQGLTQLSHDATPFAAITHRFNVGDQRARSLLAGAGIGIDLQTTSMTALSGGQKARLAMLVLRLTRPNFYLLDEPTNHLDIEGQEALEAELLADGATCLLVSHDRTFVRNVANRFWLIDGRKLAEVDGPEPFFASASAT